MQIPVCVLPPDKNASAVWATTVIAAFAVVVGPIVTWFLTNKQIKAAAKATTEQLEAACAATQRQLEAARLTANKQIVAPMREEWISKLREKISAILSLVSVYAVPGTDPSHEHLRELSSLAMEIFMMLNTTEENHRTLEHAIKQLLNLMHDAHTGAPVATQFHNLRNEILETARGIFKKEWDRVKTEDAN